MWCTSLSRLLLVSVFCTSGVVATRAAVHVDVPPMPASTFLDTEVSTNLVFGQDADTRMVQLGFVLDRCPAVCFQVALGTDVNADGILDFGETDALFGWRNGRYFAEDVRGGRRYEEVASTNHDVHTLNIEMKLTKVGTAPRWFSATNETGTAVFAELAARPPAWLHDFRWDLMRVTRRGPGTPAEWFTCDLRSNRFYIRMR